MLSLLLLLLLLARRNEKLRNDADSQIGRQAGEDLRAALHAPTPERDRGAARPCAVMHDSDNRLHRCTAASG